MTYRGVNDPPVDVRPNADSVTAVSRTSAEEANVILRRMGPSRKALVQRNCGNGSARCIRSAMRGSDVHSYADHTASPSKAREFSGGTLPCAPSRHTEWARARLTVAH